MNLLALTLGIVSCMGIIFFKARLKAQRRPPGPRGYPIIGNLLDLPSARDWTATIQDWGKRWGDLISLSVLGTDLIFINSYSMAVDILEKKSGIYSDRPYMPMAMELMDMKDSIGLISAHDKRFVLCRRMFQQGLGRTAISSFFPQEEYAARRFIKKVSASPNNLKAHCLEHAGAIILKVAYGYELQDTESRVDPMVHIVNIAMENFNKATAPGGFLVNQLHILMKMPDWFPGASFKRLGRSWAKDYWKMVDIPFNYVKQQIVQGTAKESFTATWLSQNLSYQDELNLKHTSSSMFGAGVDTSAVTFYAFYFAMAKYPTIQKMAQAEIDSVVGRDRLPNFLDRAHMPYIEALCKEITRYHVAVPNGMPHCTSRDDIHDGMFIPAGAIVMANIWSMAHDPKVYNHPMEFNPMRFLGEYPEQNPREYVWGFGRRICPGRLLADASIFITVALTLAVFDIRLTPDAPTILKPIPGIVSDIEPFNCIITFRDLDAEKLIHLLD